ncbi:MAG: 50S ribosomal protein L18 [Clostridia bacterium]|nr:50S ribosomal protein L18 [Clostridia bacterium]MBQ4586357.1 50S ribosomal protein L18 [Clostridia bacterium]MBQ6883678.1 50S ribosomal protein L18 [Clostridia bacterium]
MVTKIDKNQDRLKRHARVRRKISGTAEAPRLCVFRSLNHIYAQIIDDVKGHTLVACSSVEKEIAAQVEGKDKKGVAKLVGQKLAEKALAKGISVVVFDRGGYLYTGRVASLADGAREGGLKF